MTITDELQLRRDRLIREAEALDAKLDLAFKFGDDDYEELTVIRFDKHLGHGGKTYSYAAIKTNGFWYISGPVGGGKSFTWNELITWLIGGHSTVEIWRVDTYVEIVPEG